MRKFIRFLGPGTILLQSAAPVSSQALFDDEVFVENEEDYDDVVYKTDDTVDSDEAAFVDQDAASFANPQIPNIHNTPKEQAVQDVQSIGVFIPLSVLVTIFVLFVVV
uniref:Uncharacterized protein n=1 Tax=Lygus hesperus TaxID=30085 RepID=A0A146MEK9_LYGHE